ncbi:MAG: PAS domain S-box protein, partial [bacterium]|nr:PAS domain S-box protein [bacterium]
MSKGNILIVEDDIQLLPVFKAVLKNDGYKVTLAETGEKAVKLLKVNEYDLILSDIVLGGVDGIEVLKAAKEQNPDTAVIMITGYSSTESAVDALREGADDYIQKPSSNDELLVRIERAMEKTRLKMELKIAEDRYSNIIKTSMDGYYMVDNRGDFLDANDSFCKMIGYDRNELLKMKIADIEAIESPDDVKKHIEKIIKKGYDSFESKHKCKSGNVINVEISANYTEDNGGKIYSFARDITKRKETERELKKSEEKYHDVFEKMGYGVAVYEAVEGGRDFIFKDLNKAGEKISKVKKKDIISRTVTEYFPGVKKLGLFNTLQNVWKTGKARYIPDSLYEDDRLKLWLDNSVFKIHSGEIVAVYRDITEDKKAEVALKENELKYRTLVDTIPDVVYRIDPDGKFTYLNDSVKFLGYKPGDLIGKHYKEILHPGDYKRFSSEFALPELRGKKI